MMRWVGLGFAVVSISLLASAARAEEEDKRPAKALQDNSFLIEEAYNQDAGMVQHILTARRQGKDWFLNFTQEWPIGSEKHQFSYSLPFSYLRSDGLQIGLGDVMLNYRYQLLTETNWLPAVSPRVSVVAPSGDTFRGLGAGWWGYQLALPVSKIVTDRMTLHANVGMTSYFDTFKINPTSFFVGGSAVYAVTREFNLMLEVLREWNESVDFTGAFERERVFTVSPGFRYAFNLDAGQLVTGVGAPIRFVDGTNKPDYGVLLYLSFEHNFLAKKAK
jgi:hypothetical protein